ncbi:RtcB family protein [Candidatus Dojkabacteria bacterium]|jgi:RNA-splicing ligase RtcB|nr:RtcB family protein [Candidatus Dojkabacteria bacterium]
MIEIKGKYTTAKIMIDDVEETAMNQIYNIVNHIATKDQKIAIMCDVHAGAGNAVIGFSMTLGDKITGSWVGVDVGCGVLAINIGKDFTTNKDKLFKIDDKIRDIIPMGNNIQSRSAIPSNFFEKNFPWIEANDTAKKFIVSYNKKFNTNFKPITFTYDWFLNKQKQIGMKQDAELGISSLGGGNHFISIEKSINCGYFWLLIHCGSRNFGKMICEYHMNVAKKILDKKRNIDLNSEIIEIKKNFSGQEIPIKIKEAKQRLGVDFDINMNGTEYLECQYAIDYYMDMIFAQVYAKFNRSTISNNILNTIGCTEIERIESIHNYIDFDDLIIRKGAIRSYIGEKIIVPISMAFGSFLCEGKSNPDFNFTSPHGAGRLKSRGEASKTIDMKDFEYSMKGIVSTSVVKNCIDESPMAYKSPKTIEVAIEPTAKIFDTLKPILNIKDKGETATWKERKERMKAEKTRDLERTEMRKMKR